MDIADVVKHLLFQQPRIWKYRFLSDIKRIEGKADLKQPVLFAGRGKIVIGDGVIIGTFASPFLYSSYSYVEARQESSLIEIGDRVWTNNNLVIISNGSTIAIGQDTLIGLNVEIMDSDFHDISPKLRRDGQAHTAPVRIGNNVWIGSNVKILKGVTIGVNAIIANGSTVVDNIPENVIAAGVPARIIKEIER